MTDDLHVNNSYNRETLWHARRTTRKLKTYQTSLCFYDLAIAAPSMKAALEAWGAGSNLFHQGVAKESTTLRSLLRLCQNPESFLGVRWVQTRPSASIPTCRRSWPMMSLDTDQRDRCETEGASAA